MLNFIYLFVCIFLSKELFFFDEEFLVVLSFFTVFTLLFQSLGVIVAAELDSRYNSIYNQFLGFLKAKKELLELVHLYYQKRNYQLFLKFLEITKHIVIYLQEKYINKVISLIS
jgi:hypothetical protein